MQHRSAGKGIGSLGRGSGQFWRAAAAGRGGTEAFGEFLNASGGVDEFLLAREKRVGGGGDAQRHNVMIYPINHFRLLGGGGGAGDEAGTAGGVHENDVVKLGMEIRFHGRQKLTVEEPVAGLRQEHLLRKNRGNRKRILEASAGDATGIRKLASRPGHAAIHGRHCVPRSPTFGGQMLETSHLQDGRTLTYRQFGQPDGEPVFFFHGWPGECHQASLLHEAALEQRVRLIAPNRPGIGGSSPQPERSLLDWPPLVAALADSLEINRFRILGLSGGGPYALAAAVGLADRVPSVGILGGVVPSVGADAAPGGLVGFARRFSPLLPLIREPAGVVLTSRDGTSVRPDAD